MLLGIKSVLGIREWILVPKKNQHTERKQGERGGGRERLGEREDKEKEKETLACFSQPEDKHFEGRQGNRKTKQLDTWAPKKQELYCKTKGVLKGKASIAPPPDLWAHMVRPQEQTQKTYWWCWARDWRRQEHRGGPYFLMAMTIRQHSLQLGFEKKHFARGCCFVSGSRGGESWTKAQRNLWGH